MREEKKIILENMLGWLRQSPFVIVTDYKGLKVEEFAELRKRLAQVGAEAHVIKNTFLRRALNEEKLPEMTGDLKGQTAVVYGKSEVSAAAKVIKNFAAEFQKPQIRAALVDKTLLGKDAVLTLASLPSREVLLAQLLGLLQAPASKLARLVQTPASQLARVIQEKATKG
ncbi:MAG: 50S ribosomal protein L10 [bacterium]